MRYRSAMLPAAAGALIVCGGGLSAKFAMFGERVPAPRLIQNVSQYVREHPKDARAHYTLGRLHSIAYTGVKEGVYVVLKDRENNKPLPLPEFGPTDSVQVERQDPAREITSEQAQHLVHSLAEYRRATEMAPKEALYWLGLAWMYEQATKIASDPAKTPPKTGYRELALSAYRKAYRLRKAEDAAKPSISGNGNDATISQEAGEGILRLIGKTRILAEMREVRAVKAHLETIKKKPMYVTPIVIGKPNRSLASLLAPGRTVRFDLAGNGRQQTWPWVKPDTGILVWDPLRTGRVTSGRQLFGSRTWQMFWRNGYEPLAALDDNRDGSLIGAELAGISVWHDRNANGRSDRGEVVTAQQAGLVSVAVRPTGLAEGVQVAEAGVVLRDGTTRPSFDWTPRSITTPLRR